MSTYVENKMLLCRKEFDNEAIIVDEKDSILFKSSDGNSDDLFKEYKKVVLNTLITSFGLDAILFQDREGGNVQTIHNFENGIYADDKFKQRGEREYKRKDYAPCKENNKRRKQDFQNRDRIIDGYTGKVLPKDGRAELEHVVSVKEHHNNAPTRMLNSKEEIKELIYDDPNLIYTDASLNSSKQDKSLEEFMATKAKGQQQNNKDRFGIDEERARAVDKRARKNIDNHNARKKLIHYSSNIGKDSLTQGSKLAIRQALGIIFTEITFVIYDEIQLLVKKPKVKIEDFLKSTGEICKRSINQVKNKFKHILDSIKSGFISGVLSSISTTLINMFLSTAKNIVKIIRQAWTSIVEAVKILVLNPQNLSVGEKIKAAAKVILTGLSVIVGVMIDQAFREVLQKTTVSSIPIVGPILDDVIPIFFSGLFSGLMSVSIIYFIDNSDVVKRLVDFIDSNPFNSVLDDYKLINKKINAYAAELMKFDIKEFEAKAKDYKELNEKLDNFQGDISLVLYEFLQKNDQKLQFRNFFEFDACMRDENFVLEL